MEYDKLREALMSVGFSEAQFREIKAICDIRLGNYSAREGALQELSKVPSNDVYPVLFHSQLRDVLKQEAEIKILPYSKLRSISAKDYKQLCTVANFLFSISEEWNKDKSRTRYFAIGVFRLYCTLVVAYLREVGIPVALRTSLQHSDKFIGLVDKAFPGYVESGAINMVVLKPENRV